MIENLIFDVLDNMTEKQKEDFYFLCSQDKRIQKRIEKCCNEDFYDEKN